MNITRGNRYIDFLEKNFKNHYLIKLLHNVNISYNFKKFNIKHILITPKEIALIEIKNYNDYIDIKSDGTIYLHKKRVTLNPLRELKEKEFFIKKMLSKSYFQNVKINSYILFDDTTIIKSNRLPYNYYKKRYFVNRKYKEIEKMGVIEDFKALSKILNILQREQIANLFNSATIKSKRYYKVAT